MYPRIMKCWYHGCRIEKITIYKVRDGIFLLRIYIDKLIRDARAVLGGDTTRLIVHPSGRGPRYIELLLRGKWLCFWRGHIDMFECMLVRPTILEATYRRGPLYKKEK